MTTKNKSINIKKSMSGRIFVHEHKPENASNNPFIMGRTQLPKLSKEIVDHLLKNPIRGWSSDKSDVLYQIWLTSDRVYEGTITIDDKQKFIFEEIKRMKLKPLDNIYCSVDIKEYLDGSAAVVTIQIKSEDINISKIIYILERHLGDTYLLNQRYISGDDSYSELEFYIINDMVK